MAKRFLAAQPGDQNAMTVRQFRDIEAYLLELEARLAPKTGGADVGVVDPLDPIIWSALPFSDSTIPEDDGVYWGSLRLSATGTNANAWIQLRATWGGVQGIPADELVGDPLTVGNNALILATLSGPLAVGINMNFWVRGENAIINSGKLNMMRIGTGDVLRGQL